MLILEKVWAKIFGSYQRIEAGTAGEAFYPLTGCPHKVSLHGDITDLDRFWRRVKSADDRKMPMCTAVASVATEGKKTRADMKSVGLVDAHAYSLIAAAEVQLDNGR